MNYFMKYMVTKEQARKKLKELIEQFSQASKNKDYIDSQNEEWVKWNYVEPLFELLGWERQDIEKETRILKGRADYILKIGNEEVLVIEAKKTSVRLSEDEGRQAVSYAYHRKIKFAVLINFKEIRVYHALTNIKNIDKNLLKLGESYFRLVFEQFLDNFDKLWLLSKESFENGKIYELLSKKDEKASKPIDESILEDLLYIRELLSKDIKKLRAYLSQEQIDEAVQILIDRLIFMRSVEDRGLENKNFLLGIVKDFREGRIHKRIWDILEEQFLIFDKQYNSKLFAKSILEDEKNIFFDDNTLQEVIRILYFGKKDFQERYMFDEIPGDLLGTIYEQYLGTILQSTEKRVKLESETGKRKKMGIYYTPSYIVDYIVKNTVGEYIKNKTIDEILEVNIVDPACGSGSFLMSAFQELCNTIEQKLKSGEKAKSTQFQFYKDRLTLGQKASIMSNCIYGVDLDEKAVELAQLNLLLKILEEETPDTHKRLLPNLRDNIKNGNSLIDDSKIAGDKAFNWHAQFPDVFRNGGFDVVIGNPPYVRIQTLNKKDVDYFNKMYESPEKNYDIYILFVERGHKILKENGRLGYILPNKFFSADYGKNLRNYISKNKAIKEIVDFKDYQIFENATTYTCLLFLDKEDNTRFFYCTPKNLMKLNKGILNKDNLICFEQKIPVSDLTWSFSDGNSSQIFQKFDKIDLRLNNIAEAIFQGMITGADRYYFVKIIKEERDNFIVKNNLKDKEYKIEKSIIKKLLKGKEIRKWSVNWEGYSVLYPYDLSQDKASLIQLDIIKSKYPNFYHYLKDYEKELKSREENRFNEDKNWYKFGRTQNIDKFKKKKIMTQVLSNSNKFVLDENGEYYFVGGGNAGGYGIILKEEFKEKYKLLLGLLNSKTLEFYLKNISTRFRGGYYSYAKRFIEKFPICLPKKSQEQKIVSLVDKMLSLQKQLHETNPTGNEKERLEQQIKNIDYEIDEEVYKLYGLNDEEIKIVEESLK